MMDLGLIKLSLIISIYLFPVRNCPNDMEFNIGCVSIAIQSSTRGGKPFEVSKRGIFKTHNPGFWGTQISTVTILSRR